MKMKSLAMLVVLGALSFPSIAPAFTDTDDNSNNQSVQGPADNAMPNQSNDTMPNQNNDMMSNQNNDMNNNSNMQNDMMHNNPNSANNEISPDTATGDDDY